MLNQLRIAALLLVTMTVGLGVVYPVTVTVFGKLFFPHEATGSLISVDGRPIGSELIGQRFISDRYFHGRPSDAGDGYDGTSSGGSNLGPTSYRLIERIDARTRKLMANDPSLSIPADMVTSSGSGLDPDISPAAAEFQVPRVARSRGISETDLRELVRRHTEHRQFGFLGEPRVNVLRLNLALDAIK